MGGACSSSSNKSASPRPSVAENKQKPHTADKRAQPEAPGARPQPQPQPQQPEEQQPQQRVTDSEVPKKAASDGPGAQNIALPADSKMAGYANMAMPGDAPEPTRSAYSSFGTEDAGSGAGASAGGYSGMDAAAGGNTSVANHGYDTVDGEMLSTPQNNVDEGYDAECATASSDFGAVLLKPAVGETPEERVRYRLGGRDLEEADWQAEFEAVLRRPHATAEERLSKAVALKQLSQRFSASAALLAKVLVEDAPLPAERRAVQPLSGKGVLGGDKYLYKGIFVKFVVDPHGIFGGDLGASKAAKHELKSLQQLVACHVDGLYFPLLSVVDHLGYRLVCMSHIRGITDTSLAYGSCDAGATVHSDDPRLNERIRQACEAGLQLAAHNVIDSQGTIVPIYGPTDLEGHVVRGESPDQDKFYLLDFSRLLPPESPRAGDESMSSMVAVVYDPDPSVEPAYHTIKPAERREFLGRQLADFALRREEADSPPAADLPAEYEERLSARATGLLAQMNVRTLNRSEGQIHYNSRSRHPVNGRASDVAGVEVRGRAVVFQEMGKIFYFLMRPELVREAGEPLSSDAFSGFGSCRACASLGRAISAALEEPDPDSPPAGRPTVACPHLCELNHQVVDQVTRDLYGRRISKMAESLDSRQVAPSDGPGLVAAVHAAGLNVRHLGLLRAQVKAEHVRRSLLVEMLTRTLRHAFAARIKAAQARRRSTPAAAAAALLSLALGSGPASDSFWGAELRPRLLRKFGESALSPQERDPSFDLRTGILKFPLMVQVVAATGVRLVARRLDALFDDPTLFDAATPLVEADIESLEPRVRTVDVDAEIVGHLYTMAQADAGGGGAGSAGPNNAEALTVSEAFHRRAVEVLGPSHPHVISSSFKVAAMWSRGRRQPEASKLVLETLDRCAASAGKHAANYVVGLVTAGAVYAREDDSDTALAYFRRALRLVDRLHGRHPLQAKLYTYVARLELARARGHAGDVMAAAVRQLREGFALYEEFYGRAVADYVAPMITMGKGEEVAVALGALAYQLRDLVQSQADHRAWLRAERELAGDELSPDENKATDAEDMFARLTSAICVMEDLEGVPRGYFNGRSLEIEDRTLQFQRAARSAAAGASGAAEAEAGAVAAALAKIETARSPPPAGALDAAESVTFSGAGLVARAPRRVGACAPCSVDVDVPGAAADGRLHPVAVVSTPLGTRTRGFVTHVQGTQFRVMLLPYAVGEYQVTLSLARLGEVAAGGKDGLDGTLSFSVHVVAGFAVASLTRARFPAEVVRGAGPVVGRVWLRDAAGNMVGTDSLLVPRVRGAAFSAAHSVDVDGVRRDDGTFGLDFVPIVLERYSVRLFVNGVRAVGPGMPSRSEYCDVVVKARPGEGFCDMPIHPNTPSTAATFCFKCNKGTCVRCDRRLIPGLSVSGQYCTSCGIKNNNRCAGCKGMLMAAQSYPVKICRSCQGPSGFTSRCCARK